MIEVWTEGWAATGGSGDAALWGRADAATLREACDKLAEKIPAFKEHYDPERMTYWGCRLFDNEADARKSFG